MVVETERMVADVKVAIDMNKGDEPLFREGDTDTLTLDEIIRSKLADAVRIVLTEAPAVLLESGHDFGESPLFWAGDDGKGFIILPEDFLRLVAFRMSDWQRTVYDPITESDREYALQSSRFKGICGNPERPVAAIVRRSEGKVLEFYSCRDDSATVAQATYIPMPEVDREGGIDIPQGCYRAAVYRAASLVLASIGDQAAGVMTEMSKSLLQ